MPGTDEYLPDLSPLGGRIHMVRGQAVMLDSDLAEAYEVKTGALNQAVERNTRRFPPDFAESLLLNSIRAAFPSCRRCTSPVFLTNILYSLRKPDSFSANRTKNRPKANSATGSYRLTQKEWDDLISQSVTSSSAWGGRRKLPRVFTEHGAVMLASVLNSDRAIDASIHVVNAFIRLRRVLEANAALARRVEELAGNVDMHDKAIAIIFHDLQRLIAGESETEPEIPGGRIGFRTNKERGLSSRAQRK